MRRARNLAAGTLLAAVAAGCAHAPSSPAPLGDWRPLVEATQPYAAVYRFACCGRRNLVAAVRGDATAISLSIAAPPAGEVMAAWVAGGETQVFWPRDGCRQGLPGGALPVAADARLPVEPAVLALILAGRLPADATAAVAPGWFAGHAGGVGLSARLAGDPARLVRVELADPVSGAAVVVDCAEHRGRVPGTITITAGAEHAELRLASWQAGEPPIAPAWLARPPCSGAR